jgi:hypothetical protein
MCNNFVTYMLAYSSDVHVGQIGQASEARRIIRLYSKYQKDGK